MNAVQSTVALPRVAIGQTAEPKSTSVRRAAVNAMIANDFGAAGPLAGTTRVLAKGFEIGTAATLAATLVTGASIAIGYGLQSVIGPGLFESASSLLGPVYLTFGLPTMACLLGMVGSMGLGSFIKKHQKA